MNDVTSNCVPAESNLPVSLKNEADPGFDRISSGGICIGMMLILVSFRVGPGRRVAFVADLMATAGAFTSGGSGKFDNENSLRSDVAEKALLRVVKEGVNTIVFRVLSRLVAVTTCSPLTVRADDASL